jgi:hypothetical protein
VFATALYDNEPDEADELAFSAGDKIEVLQQDGSGCVFETLYSVVHKLVLTRPLYLLAFRWWKGRLRGKEGLFPANFVRLD